MENINNSEQKEGIDFEEEEEGDYIDLDHAIEVEENDDDIPMDEDEDDEAEAEATMGGEDEMGHLQEKSEAETSADGSAFAVGGAGTSASAMAVEDMSFQSITSHKPSSVFAVASYMNTASNVLSIITGGGDDRAFLHKLDNGNVLSTVPLNHQHTDSVSCVATNESLVSSDLAKTPKYIAVGGYDGNIVLYNPGSGEKIQVLDGPTDVEFISFHPKGGSVSIEH